MRRPFLMHELNHHHHDDDHHHHHHRRQRLQRMTTAVSSRSSSSASFGPSSASFDPSSFSPSSASSLGAPPPVYAAAAARCASPTAAAVAGAHPRTPDELSSPPGRFRPLDLGPPGYQATVVLFEGTPDERTVYLGPWEVVGSDQRRVVWRCSYQLELVEHFLPPTDPSAPDTIAHTLHARHRPFADPCQLEQSVAFGPGQRHRVRYTGEDGAVALDGAVEVRYEFTTVEAAIRFQGDVRDKDLVDCFDVDVAWSDAHGRTDAFGHVRGLAAVQRLKLWCDRRTAAHSLSLLANRAERRHREYPVAYFEAALAARDDRRLSLRLNAANAARPSRRNPLAAFRRHLDHAQSPVPRAQPNVRYLAIQFTRFEDYRRFLHTWVVAHSSDSEFHGIVYPQSAFELPSPEISPGAPYELPSQSTLYRDPSRSTAPESEEDGGAPGGGFSP